MEALAEDKGLIAEQLADTESQQARRELRKFIKKQWLVRQAAE